ncbi:MAG: hypothetical protein EBU31_01090 [Proteobacteria bacterium]|nr:hypothetical protein [Pseudomonadota bacterium]
MDIRFNILSADFDALGNTTFQIYQFVVEHLPDQIRERFKDVRFGYLNSNQEVEPGGVVGEGGSYGYLLEFGGNQNAFIATVEVGTSAITPEHIAMLSIRII